MWQLNSHLPLFENGNHSSHRKIVDSESVEKLRTIQRVQNFQILKRFEVFDAMNVQLNGNFRWTPPIHNFPSRIGVITR